MRPLFAFAFLTLLGCDAVQSDDGFVRFVHAAPNAPAVQVFLGDAPDDAIRFGETLSYITVGVGDPRVRVRNAADASRRYIDQLVRVEDEGVTTLVLLDTTVSKPYLYLEDDLPGAALPRSIRLVHGAPGIGALNVFEADEDGAALSTRPVVTLGFRENSGFLGVGIGTTTIVAVERDAPFRRFTAQPRRGRLTFVLVEQNGLLRGVELDEMPPPNAQ